MKAFLPLLGTALLVSACSSGIELADNGRSDYRIVIAADADSLTQLTAARFQRYFNQISQATLPIVTDAEAATPKEIVFGRPTAQPPVTP